MGRIPYMKHVLIENGLSPQFLLQKNVIREVHARRVGAEPEDVFSVFTRLGGDRGWLVWNWAWRLRGFIDKLIGGPGMRRGRRDSQRLQRGDAVDFWRVEEVDSPVSLLLRAEMKVPGRAWLHYECYETATGTELVQTVVFEPRGTWGTVYWKLSYPIHKIIFGDMVKAVSMEAEIRRRRRAA